MLRLLGCIAVVIGMVACGEEEKDEGESVPRIVANIEAVEAGEQSLTYTMDIDGAAYRLELARVGEVDQIVLQKGGASRAEAKRMGSAVDLTTNSGLMAAGEGTFEVTEEEAPSLENAEWLLMDDDVIKSLPLPEGGEDLQAWRDGLNLVNSAEPVAGSETERVLEGLSIDTLEQAATQQVCNCNSIRILGITLIELCRCMTVVVQEPAPQSPGGGGTGTN